MNWHKIIPSKKHIRYGFIILLVIVIIGPILYYFSDIANFLFGETQKYNGEFVKFILTIIGGGFIYYGLLLNARRTKAVEKQNKLTRKGQVDERFKNAIEHLGRSTEDAIVLGGIYALHRIAQEDQSYRKTVFDILCSYIRDKTSSLKLWDEIPEGEKGTIKPTIVIQTIIDLLFKISDSQDYIYTGLKANLNGIRCIHANFNGAHLVDADMNNAHMEGTELNDVHLESANMVMIKCEGTEIKNTHFEGADLNYANFEGADLDQVHFERTKIVKANFEGASINDTNFEGAELIKANFKGAILSKAYFGGSNLLGAHFEGVYLNMTHFEGSELSFVHFEGAELWFTYFEGANLNQTHFEGAELSLVHFEGVDSSGPLSSEFPQNLRNRIGKESEFINVYSGKLDSVVAQKICENICLTTDWQCSPSDFAKRINEAVNRDTNIEKDAITGILTKEKADEIIERYNKAMANVPGR